MTHELNLILAKMAGFIDQTVKLPQTIWWTIFNSVLIFNFFPLGCNMEIIGKIHHCIADFDCDNDNMSGIILFSYHLFAFLRIRSSYVLSIGGRTAPEIISWLEKKTGPPAKELTTAEEVKAFTEKSDVVVVGFYKDKDSENAKAFIGAAEGTDDVEFGIVHDEALAKENNVEGDSVVLFKKVCTTHTHIYVYI